MARTNAVLGAGDAGDARPQQFLDRNRAISAAYARLAQGDPRMRWAGIASVVSTQAHCAMQDANVAVDRAETVHRVAPPAAGAAARAAASQVPVVGPFAAPRAGEAARRAVADQTGPLAEMTHQVQDALYDTNREISADIYPAVAMYDRHGMAGVGSGPGQCGGARPDRPMPRAIQNALQRLDDDDVEGGSLILARYEQTEIVQQRIYEDPRRPLLKPAMQLNQVVSSVPGVREAANLLMRARRPEVAISTECGEGRPVPFRGDITVASDRVGYYRSLVREYMTRDQATRDAMSRVIAGRDPLRGGSDYSYPTPPWRSSSP